MFTLICNAVDNTRVLQMLSRSASVKSGRFALSKDPKSHPIIIQIPKMKRNFNEKKPNVMKSNDTNLQQY